MIAPGPVTRRQFLGRLGATGALLWLPVPDHGGTHAAAVDPWRHAREITRRIVAPSFPGRTFDLAAFGAVPDGTTLCTDAFRRAIEACHAAGGGRVVVPGGRVLTGAIHLKSGVNLHVPAGATIAFSRDPRHYLPVVFTRWEGVELMNYSPFIYAFEQERIAITGSGTLDGQADETHWWPWKGRDPKSTETQAAARARLIDMGERDVPVADRVFGEGSYLRPNFIQPYRCRQVLIEGVRIINSPMWEIHPVLSRNVIVRGVRIESHGPNNDGCDPESCSDVLIERCAFDTGDDCIALKSGRNRDGRRLNVPVENVIIRDCTMKDGHGGVVIGSEISGGARWIFAERCRMDSPQLDRALRIKTNAVRGGVVEHVFMRRVTVGQVAEAVVTVNYFYEEGQAGEFPPVVRDVEVREVTSRRSRHALLLRGFPGDPIRDIRLVDCRFDQVEQPDILEAVEGVSLRNVRVNGTLRNEVLTR